MRVDVILLGLGRFGGAIQRQLQPHNLSILGIDFDPQALRLAAAQGLPVQYGDSEDPEFTASLPLSSATVVVSTLPSLEANAAIHHGLETAGFRATSSPPPTTRPRWPSWNSWGPSAPCCPFSMRPSGQRS